MSPGVVDGVHVVRTVFWDGIEVPQLRRCDEGATLDNGLRAEASTRGLVTLGDGTLVDNLRDALGSCDLCRVEVQQRVEEGSLDPLAGRFLALHHRERLAYSESGLCLCHRHRRVLQTPEGERIISTIEAQELELQQIMQRPLAAAASLALRPRS